MHSVISTKNFVLDKNNGSTIDIFSQTLQHGESKAENVCVEYQSVCTSKKSKKKKAEQNKNTVVWTASAARSLADCLMRKGLW